MDAEQIWGDMLEPACTYHGNAFSPPHYSRLYPTQFSSILSPRTSVYCSRGDDLFSTEPPVGGENYMGIECIQCRCFKGCRANDPGWLRGTLTPKGKLLSGHQPQQKKHSVQTMNKTTRHHGMTLCCCCCSRINSSLQ